MALPFFKPKEASSPKYGELTKETLEKMFVDAFTGTTVVSSTSSGTLSVLIDRSRPVWYMVEPGTKPSHYGKGHLQGVRKERNSTIDSWRERYEVHVEDYGIVIADSVKPRKE